MTTVSLAISVFRYEARGLAPGSFAMVMATGIVAVACQWLEMPRLAGGLFWLSAAAFLLLWAMTLARIILYCRRLRRDIADHRRSMGFFTAVAGACMLGDGLVTIVDHRAVAMLLWLFATALWFALTYSLFATCFLKERKPTLAEGIDGGWLLAVVATQAIADLGAAILPQFGRHQDFALFACLALWLLGIMLYVWLMSLIVYRFAFFPLSPAGLTPLYWINMGAMAISTLTGTTLILSASQRTLSQQLAPFVAGGTILCWATATWWIPILTILGLWRHIYKRFTLTYGTSYWGLVFPLGMYATCTLRLSKVVHLPILIDVAHWYLYVALATWLVTFAGLIDHLRRRWIKCARKREPHTRGHY